MKLSHKEAIIGYAFIAPALFFIFIFRIIPVIYAMCLSFMDYNFFASPVFVGLANFQRAFTDSEFINSIRVTVEYVVIIVPMIMIGSLIYALILNSVNLKARTILSAIYVMPIVVNVAITALIWQIIYNPSFGIIADVFWSLGIPPPHFLSDTPYVIPSIAFMSFWIWGGYYSIIFLAGLQDVPQDLIESASIDGAGSFDRFRHITLPLLRPATLWVFVISTLIGFQVFAEPYILTGGGPANASRTIAMVIIQEAFGALEVGYASALSMILFIMLIALTAIQFRTLQRRT